MNNQNYVDHQPHPYREQRRGARKQASITRRFTLQNVERHLKTQTARRAIKTSHIPQSRGHSLLITHYYPSTAALWTVWTYPDPLDIGGPCAVRHLFCSWLCRGFVRICLARERKKLCAAKKLLVLRLPEGVFFFLARQASCFSILSFMCPSLTLPCGDVNRRLFHLNVLGKRTTSLGTAAPVQLSGTSRLGFHTSPHV